MRIEVCKMSEATTRLIQQALSLQLDELAVAAE
jgi:hypothetical protein